MAVCRLTYHSQLEKPWERRLRNAHESFIKAGLAGRLGSETGQFLVGCTATKYIELLELAAEVHLRPSESLFGLEDTIKRRGTKRGDLQINHLLGVKNIPLWDWDRARIVFHWTSVSILPVSYNSAWDRACQSVYTAAVKAGLFIPRSATESAPERLRGDGSGGLGSLAA
jgi:hypothetical protein